MYVCMCAAERQKPVSKQRGAAQCLQCLKWFRSRGGLDVYRGVWKVAGKLKQQWQAGMWCVRCALGASGGRGTRRGTSVWLRDRSL